MNLSKLCRVRISNPKESENRNGKGGTICRGIRDARIKMPDKNFLCRQLGFDRHMHEDELDEQDLYQTNWQDAGICWFSNSMIFLHILNENLLENTRSNVTTRFH